MKKNLPTNVIVSISFVITWIAFGTIMFHLLESWTWIQSFYFSVITITTVGYGDLSPSTDISRLFTAIYILVGVTIGLASLGTIGSNLLQRRESKISEKK